MMLGTSGYGDGIEKSLKCRMNAKETHKMPVKWCPERVTAICEDGWINVHPRRECAQNGSEQAYTAMCDLKGMDGMNGKYGRHTRSAYGIMVSDTGYGSKSRKVMIIPRRNGKSWMTAVKSMIEAAGEEEASKIIAEVEKKMESDIEKDDEMDIGRDIEDIADMEVQ